MTSKIIYTLSLLSVLICSPILAQDGLQSKFYPDIYTNTDLSSVIKPGQAFILYDYAPAGGLSNTTIYTYRDIKSGKASIDWSYYTGSSSIGRVRYDTVGNLEHVLGVIDSRYYYVSGLNTSFRDFGLPSLNSQLSLIGLGSIAQRFAFISSLDINDGLITVSPVDFRSNLRPWIIAGIAVFLAVPFWFLMRRFLRG